MLALLALTLAGCAPAVDLPAAPPPPQAITLTPLTTAVTSGPWRVQVTGLPRGASVELIASDDLAGPGLCPPALAPACLDLASVDRGMGSGRAGPAGVAEFTAWVPGNAPATVEVLAYARHQGVTYVSAGLLVDVLRAAGDADSDGLTNLTEARAGSDPWLADTDGDTLSDADELANGSDPANADTDDDGLTDDDELARGTAVLRDDTDDDGLRDGPEVTHGTDPLNPDCDGDLLQDGEEVYYALDPLIADTDADGIDDFTEVTLCFFGGECPDPHLADTDGDGLLDGEERALGTNYARPDTDRDGLPDNEGLTYGTDPLDPDSDGGSVLDGEEVAAGTDPRTALDDPGSVRINELDVDQPGADREEFIELFNPGTTDVDLSDLAVVLVDGAAGLEYARYPLTGVLTPGLYVLIASPRVVAPPGTPRLPLVPATDAIEDGLGDGVAIIDVVRLEVRDAVIYERMGGPYTLVGFPDPVDLAGGQLPTVFDPGRGDETIARFPNGVDHNDAPADFASRAGTPGAAN